MSISICLSIYLFIYLCIYLFISLSLRMYLCSSLYLLVPVGLSLSLSLSLCFCPKEFLHDMPQQPLDIHGHLRGPGPQCQTPESQTSQGFQDRRQLDAAPSPKLHVADCPYIEKITPMYCAYHSNFSVYVYVPYSHMELWSRSEVKV